MPYETILLTLHFINKKFQLFKKKKNRDKNERIVPKALKPESTRFMATRAVYPRVTINLPTIEIKSFFRSFFTTKTTKTT